jgi:Tfp pilus assembly pilus retraction ATPase PilT
MSIFHTNTADVLGKIMEHAQHQGLMLIYDKTGIGNSTILTHTSKQIRQNFPAKLFEEY